jgi:hypothetical protein
MHAREFGPAKQMLVFGFVRLPQFPGGRRGLGLTASHIESEVTGQSGSNRRHRVCLLKNLSIPFLQKKLPVSC